jgi:hypothetical protein
VKLSDLPVGLGGWNVAASLFPFGAEPALSLQQVKVEVFDGFFSNLSLFLIDIVSCLPQKRKKEASPFHTVLLGWFSQQEVIYILEEYAAMQVS